VRRETWSVNRLALPLWVRCAALPWLAVGLVILLVVQPLRGALPQGHDTLLHFYRIPEMNALWQHGVLFSRWSPDLWLGYGYPLLNFYPPLSMYVLTVAYWATGANAPLGLSLVFALALLVAATSMFVLARELYGVAGGLLATCAYALSPTLLYHTFERGSLSNALAMALFPLAALALIGAVRAPTRRRLALAALLLGAVLLAHTAASLAFVGPLVGLGLVTVFTAEQPRIRSTLALTLAVAGGLALSAFVWLPALAEVRFTQYAAAIRSPDVHYSHFFGEVLRWPGPAIAGLSNPPLPVSMGLGQLLLGIIVCVLALVRLAKGCGEREDWLSAVAGLLGLGAVFLATPLSSRLWEHVALLQNSQFPWRWLDPAAFLLAMVCGWLVRQLRPWQQVGIVGGMLLVFFANAVPYFYPPRWQSLPMRPTLADVTDVQVEWGIYGLTSWGEYAPATSSLRPTTPPFPGADMGASLAEKLQREMLPAEAVLSTTGSPWRADLRLRLPTPQLLVFDTFYFPGWAARIDDVAAALEPDAEGRLTLSVPAGQHTVSVYYGSTPTRTAADGLSALAVGVVVLALLWPRRFRVRPQPGGASADAIPLVLTLSGLLCILLLLKIVWLDHFDTPLVRHVRNETLAGTNTPESRNFGEELWLVGYRLDAPDDLTLYWQAQRTPAHDYTVEVTLTDARGAPVQVIQHTDPGLSSTSRWQPGQLVRDAYALPLATAPRPSAYRLTVAVLDPDSGVRLRLLDAPDTSITAAALGAVKVPPLAGTSTGNVLARFGEAIELEQVEMPAAVQMGTRLPFALVWRSLAPVNADYTVFVHLLRADGTLAATADAPPCAGLYPTSFWSPGERIIDERQWLVTAPAGEYQVEVGLYRLDTGERLPISGENADPNSRVILGVLRVIP
jgi:hypothetical protein